MPSKLRMNPTPLGSRTARENLLAPITIAGHHRGDAVFVQSL